MQVSQEFDHITGLVNSMDKFVTDWQSTWMNAIITVSKEEGLLTFTNDTADDGMLTYLCGMILVIIFRLHVSGSVQTSH